MRLIERYKSFTADGSNLEGRVIGHGRGLPSVIAWTGNVTDARDIAAALNVPGAVELVRELRQFMPIDKPEQGPLPDWIVSLRGSVDRFLADAGGQ